MIVVVDNLIDPKQAQDWAKGLAGEPFDPGTKTAGRIARTVKANEQLIKGKVHEEIEKQVSQALFTHPLVRLVARPKKITSIRASRYQQGMLYGAHVDDALMQDRNGVSRTDLSFTLFLNKPDTYEGGELQIAGISGVQRVKLMPGQAVLYPSGAIHEVLPVTKGERLAVVGWIQSFVRDAAQREIIADIEAVRNKLFDRDGNTAEVLRLSKSMSALLRRWSEV